MISLSLISFLFFINEETIEDDCINFEVVDIKSGLSSSKDEVFFIIVDNLLGIDLYDSFIDIFEEIIV